MNTYARPLDAHYPGCEQLLPYSCPGVPQPEALVRDLPRPNPHQVEGRQARAVPQETDQLG